jgi:hypothetical protein
MLDELSDIPDKNDKQDDIHRKIERFRQLRESYSRFDENGYIKNMVIKGDTFKPLLDKLNKINDIKWIIPVATIKRRCITPG